MKTTSRFTLLAGAVLACGLMGQAASQPAQIADPKPAPRPATSDTNHEMLSKRAGNWTLSKKLTMPGQPAMEAAGKATITSILGGRFIREQNDGMLFGQPMATEAMTGYDSDTDSYEMVWGWTGSTHIFTASGKSTDGGKTVKMTSAYDNGKGRKENLTIEQRSIDDDHFVVMLVSTLPDGKDGPTVETTYTRAK